MADQFAPAAVRIFLSYRRDDTAGYARAIADELGRHFGPDRVFIDVDDIEAGLPFASVIERAIGESQVLLVLIGRRWRGEHEAGPPRLSDPGDLVRREVGAGLARGMRVIPLLLDGARMPTEAQLPEELHALAGRNALEIDNTRFAADVERLVAALRGAVAAAPPPRSRRRLWVALAVAVLIVAGAGTLLRSHAPLGPAGTGRAAVNGAWQAEVDYDWPNAHYAERFVFGGDGAELHGSASFLGAARGLVEGVVDAEGLRFATRSAEVGGPGSRAESVHRYRGRLADGEIRFVMQTEGGLSEHVPVEFVARRVEPGASSAAR